MKGLDDASYKTPSSSTSSDSNFFSSGCAVTGNFTDSDYSGMEHITSCLCKTALKKHLITGSSVRGCLDGGDPLKLCIQL